MEKKEKVVQLEGKERASASTDVWFAEVVGERVCVPFSSNL